MIPPTLRAMFIRMQAAPLPPHPVLQSRHALRRPLSTPSSGLFFLLLPILLSLLHPALPASAQQSVLMVNVDGLYNADSQSLFTTLVQAGANATYINLRTDGQVATALSTNTYHQIWVFDLSLGADAYTSDWHAIASWFNSRPNRPIICDGRILSSYWNGRYSSEGTALTKNYYENLRSRDGGLLLGTDHGLGPGNSEYLTYQNGINSINALIGLNLFTNDFGNSRIPVDTNSPLFTFPNNLGTNLFADSSPGQVPFGIQPNGRILYTLAWYSGDQYTPGISTTISKAQGLKVQILSPANYIAIPTNSVVTMSATESNGVPPVTFTWTSDKSGLLGTGANISVTNLSAGVHGITLTAVDSVAQIDVASIRLRVGPPPLPLLSIRTAPQTVELRWPSEVGGSYQVQWNSVPGSTNWQSLGAPIQGLGFTNSVSDTATSSQTRFYRLQAQ
jgi:hypothetical protein